MSANSPNPNQPANGNNDTNTTNAINNNNDNMQRNRRGSVTSAAFTNLFQRSNSTSTGTTVFPGAITTAAMNDQRRRLSVTTIGLSGTSPTGGTPFGSIRRGSMSTNNSDSIDENAIEEDDGLFSSRAAPVTPFSRRMSFGAQAALRGTRPGGNSPPGSGNDQGFNWSEQLRSRAESTVASGRPTIGFAAGMNGSPPRSNAAHDRAKSVSEMPAPPAQAPKPRSPPRDVRPKPDHFQERILKGDFYMD